MDLGCSGLQSTEVRIALVQRRVDADDSDKDRGRRDVTQ